ncbi:hypothetical protein CIB93_33400 [Streptomyces sp. WZ.A104]|uniref:hypothetical protein n=1 Tax=Streptomyces sp. WZ.A104 TaxID=2023771 RepID=UPI000BBBCF05|nr:hypothetical protein [Streptomyces sp. WZ.A104]PCG81810.1 hypothetical protein CIB93_33400 [Streptomyces sp. WZ.A104]
MTVFELLTATYVPDEFCRRDEMLGLSLEDCVRFEPSVTTGFKAAARFSHGEHGTAAGHSERGASTRTEAPGAATKGPQSSPSRLPSVSR